MKIVVTGGTGFIGKALVSALCAKANEVVIFTRQKAKEEEPRLRARYLAWQPPQGGAWEEELDGADAVINLAGEPIAAKRWSPKQKLSILESRCDATQAIVHAAQRVRNKPKLLINASAVGYYGPGNGRTFTEQDGPGKDFLANTCKAWEAHAIRAEDLGLRVVRLRIGIVLEQEGGALAKMLPPFKMFLGGPLGDGRQWMSWIHRDDVVGLILFALENQRASGPVNATAPNPVTMKEFARCLGSALRRPSLAPVPAPVLKILLGEMSDLLLKGQHVVPKKAQELGYRFRYPQLHEALAACLKSS